jgi:hypothetical protein
MLVYLFLQKAKMKISKFLPKLIYKFFLFSIQAARVTAALENGRKSRFPIIGGGYIKPGSKPILENGVPIAWSSKDIMQLFLVTSKFKLILKNNSKHPAYSLSVLNGNSIFTDFKPLKKLTSLLPNESIEIDVKIERHRYVESGIEIDLLPNIPADLESNILLIQYENESGRKLITKFWVTDGEPYNEYFF